MITIYQHRWADGNLIDLPTGKIVCVGRNYAEHAQELDNPVPDAPILFIKPNTAVCDLLQPIAIPSGNCHFETELSVLIGKILCNASIVAVADAILGYGLGLDLTLRDIQQQLKEKGHPWETAKAFDGACPLSPFISKDNIADENNLAFSCRINGKIRQEGHVRQMLFPVNALIAKMSQHFTLLPGDVILTGTPKGVGPLQHGDQIVLELNELIKFNTFVI